MKFKQIIFIVLLIGVMFTLTGVSASQPDDNATVDALIPNQDDVAVKSNSIQDLILNARDNDTIYLDNVTYSGEDNTQITIGKSLNFVGSGNTVIDGANERFIFIIADNVRVSFANIIFANASKTGEGSDIYGGALEIHNADVTIENCRFISNSINSGKSDNIYGAAISNEGNLTIINSIFLENSLNSRYKQEGFGGAIYNNGHLYVNGTSFVRSRGGEYSKGAMLYNNNIALIENSVIEGTYSLEESMGSAIFNNGELTLLNSIVENNTIERNNFNFIYGNIFNSGLLIAWGNIFKNNTAYYKQPNSGYEGCPTIYNVGDLNMSYNAFIDNVGGFKKVYRDIYLNGGQSVYIDNNWWGSNDSPFATQAINFDKANTWLVLDVTPTYSMANINGNVNITTSWKLSNGENPQFLIPFSITFADEFGNIQISSLSDGDCIFTFNNTQNRGLYTIDVSLYSFKRSVSIDVGKIKANLEVTTNNNTYLNENLIVRISLHGENSEAITGSVSLSLNGKTSTVDIDRGSGVAVFKNLMPGDYEVKIEYGGSDIYSKAFAQSNVTVRKYPVNIRIDEMGDVYVDENFTLNVYLATEEAEGAANLYINGAFKQVVYLKYGDTLISFSNFEAGMYNMTVEVPGNEYYQRTNASVIFNVLRYDSGLNMTSSDIFINENETLKITASEDFRGEIVLSINGVSYRLFISNATTDITLTGLEAGEYDVDLTFDGNAKFDPQNASTSFEVKKYPSSLIVSIDGNTIDVKTVPESCTGGVGVYVNRRYYHSNLTGGRTSFNVEFDEGTNYIYVIYEGDDYYIQSAYNTTKGSGEAVAIIGVNVTSWEFTDFNYTVQVFEKNGFAMIGKVISVSVGSRTYDVVTNQQGMAILSLNLEKGVYEAVSTYGNLTTTNYLTINPIVFNLTADDISYGEDALITAEFDRTITGKVNFTLSNGLTAVAEISDGKATWTISNLTFGTWQVSAYYTNGLFNTSSVKTAFEVEKLESNITLDIREAFVGEDEVIKATFNNLTGNVTFTVDGTAYVVEIGDNSAELVLSNLAGLRHVLEVEYAGDDYHRNATLTQEFYIKTKRTDIALQVDDTVYGEVINVVARLDGSGTVEFTVNNIARTCEIIDGMAHATFAGLNAGTYTINAHYSGDDQFMSAQASTRFKVLKAQSVIEVFADDVCLDENIRIYARVSENATGKVSFRMTGYYSPRDKDVVNSIASWYISPLESGQYEVVATYRGDSNYYSSTATYMLNVSQTRSLLTVSVDDVSSRDNVVIKVNLVSNNGENITGTVSVQLNSRTYNVNVRDGTGTLNLGKFQPADYTGTASYDGSDRYSKARASFEFTVSDHLLRSILACENVTKYYSNDDVKFIITLTNAKNKAMAGQTVYVTINGVETAYVTDNEGRVSLDINNTLGKYDVYVEYRGSDSYHPANVTAVIEVLSTIESADVVKLYGTGVQYFAMFRDLNGRALSNANVTFEIAGKNYTYTTLPNGIVRLNINLLPATYSIVAFNPQTGQTLKNSLTIFNKLMYNRDVVNYFGAKSIYKVRAYGSDGKPVGAGIIVTFKINGKTYRVRTNQYSYAVLSLNLNPGKYVVTAEFNGTRVSNRITVKPVLTTKITSNKKTKKTIFTAKLVNTKGKPLYGKKITFKIAGKTYYAKTNKYGIARIAIKLTLKKGTYNIYTIYGKSKVLNKIRVN